MKVFRDSLVVRQQLFLTAQCVDDYVGPNSLVRQLDTIINDLNIDELGGKYKGGGAPAYHPRTMLKLLIFAYSQGLRSSRRIAELCERVL